LATSNDLVFQPEKLQGLVQTYIESNLESFYCLKTDMNSFLNEIKLTVKKAQEWVQTYISNFIVFFVFNL